MDEPEGNDLEWLVDLTPVFENYANVRKWNDNDLLGFVFGSDAERQISSVIFGSPVDLNAAVEHIRFAECSFSSDIAFIGLLILKDAEYRFDVDSLSEIAKNQENFLRLFADNEILKSADAAGFLDACYPLSLRVAVINPSHGFTATTTMQLDLHIKLGEPSSFKEGLNDAMEAEAAELNVMCFLNSEHQLLLGYGDSISDISPLFKNRRSVFYENLVTFKPLRPVGIESEDDEEPKLVPVVRISKGVDTYLNIRTCVSAFTVIHGDDSESELVYKLREALSRALYLTARTMGDHSDAAKQNFVDVDSHAFLVGKKLISAYYPHVEDESLLRSCRSKLHRIFNLPFDRPRLRPPQSIMFCCTPGLLRNPHERISGYKPLGEVSVVKGLYDYHHYLQDSFDDCGWGCAYRSLQSIWSWFILQGFTAKPIPSHREIQQSLVDCGDKGAKFVGSKQWIGSMELGFCLDNMLGIGSRMITTNSGTEVAENARQLAIHFKTVGTPVMIGGGQLAHTILGVDFNETSGECAFLVLDPHYTGEDNVSTVVSRGWCGWKAPNFWKPEHFYNLLLPLPPANVI